MPIPGEWVMGEFSEWEEHFAWSPVKTISGERVWLRKVYRRNFLPSISVLPAKMPQYITKEKLVEMRLRGDNI